MYNKKNGQYSAKIRRTKFSVVSFLSDSIYSLSKLQRVVKYGNITTHTETHTHSHNSSTTNKTANTATIKTAFQ